MGTAKKCRAACKDSVSSLIASGITFLTTKLGSSVGKVGEVATWILQAAHTALQHQFTKFSNQCYGMG